MLFMYIVKCEHPRDLLPTGSNVSVSTIVGPNGLPIEGSTVKLNCPPGWEIFGAMYMCSQNGEWEPDLKGITCNHPANSKVIPR